MNKNSCTAERKENLYILLHNPSKVLKRHYLSPRWKIGPTIKTDYYDACCLRNFREAKVWLHRRKYFNSENEHDIQHENVLSSCWCVPFAKGVSEIIIMAKTHERRTSTVHLTSRSLAFVIPFYSLLLDAFRWRVTITQMQNFLFSDTNKL